MTGADHDRGALLAVFGPDARERIGRLQESIRALTGADGAHIPADLGREAHTLSGSAATVGYDRISLLAGELEAALAVGDLERAAALVQELSAELDAAGFTARTVLYIEDDPTNLLLVQRVSGRIPGVRLLSARTASEGIDLAHREQPDLVLLDLNLPDLSGEEVLAALQADPATEAIPIVVLSASAQPSRVAALRGAGAAHYLTKPVDVDELSELLRGGPS